MAFITKVRIVNPFNENRWFNGAYSTLNARFTINGGGLSNEDKKTLQSLLFSSIENLQSNSKGDYDKWFYELAKRLTDDYSLLSFGHAQELINILMKYHFVYFYSNFDQKWNKQHLWLVPFLVVSMCQLIEWFLRI